jgi:hypothetical protein
MAPRTARLVVCSCAAGVLAGTVLCPSGCGVRAPTPALESISPARGYGDQPLRIFLRGGDFIPSFQVDPAGGDRRGDARGFSGRVGSDGDAVPLRDFDWLDVNLLSAWMAEGLPAGTHAVEIRDPRGARAELPDAFVSLGSDRQAPMVELTRPLPDAPLVPGMTVDAGALAADPEPGSLVELRWEARTAGPAARTIGGERCTLVPGAGTAPCNFSFQVPAALAAGDRLEIAVMATDNAAEPNSASAARSFTLRAAPTVTGIAPRDGGTVGGTDVVVTGSGFVPGTQVLVDGKTPLSPRGGGVVVDEHTISGRMPPHEAGSVSLVARTPVGDARLDAAFRYLEPPLITNIVPESGSPAGGTMVRILGTGFGAETRVFFGEGLSEAVPLGSPQLTSDHEIAGLTPPGKGRTSVWVFDPRTGWDQLVDGFGWVTP